MVELSVAFLTATVALTLIPAVRRWTPWPIEVLVWIGFVAVSFLTVAGAADPKAKVVTATVAWGIGQLLHTQLSALPSGLQLWTAEHRFTIATFVVIGAGADALTLAVLRSRRVAASQPQVRLNEWFVLPGRAIPEVEHAADPLAGPNRRLAAAGRARLETLRRPVLGSAAVARLAVLATHVLGPGHMRLNMVALGVSGLPHDMAAPPGAVGELPVAATAVRVAAKPRTRERKAHLRHHTRRYGAAPSTR